MNLIDLIQSDKEQAQSAIADLMQSKVFDYLDNYVLETESVDESAEELDEAQRFAKETGKKYSDQTGQYVGGKNYDKLAAKQVMSDLLKKKVKTNEEVDEAVVPGSVKKDAKGNVTTFKSVPDEPNPKSHQAKTVLKHVKGGGSYGDRANAANIKPGISGVADRIAFLNDAKKRGVLKESDLEVMDQEEFDAVLENYEQLDELSKDTLKSYVKKASAGQEDMHSELSSTKTAAKNYGGKFKGLADKLQNKVQKRASGIAKVNNKLTEESLDEMSQEEFDAIVENFEQLDEISKKTLGSYIKKANDRRGVNSISDHESEVRGKGVMTAAEKLTGGKAAGLQGLAMDARYAKSTGNKDAEGFKKTFDKRVDMLAKKK